MGAVENLIRADRIMIDLMVMDLPKEAKEMILELNKLVADTAYIKYKEGMEAGVKLKEKFDMENLGGNKES